MATLAALSIRKPTICAINGHAVGIGITMTLPFDIRLAWKGAKIGFVFGQVSSSFHARCTS
jgi:enoyl-CoA hydratase/carnithine racemase